MPHLERADKEEHGEMGKWSELRFISLFLTRDIKSGLATSIFARDPSFYSLLDQLSSNLYLISTYLLFHASPLQVSAIAY